MKSKEEETGTEREERGGRIEGEGEVNGFRTNYDTNAECLFKRFSSTWSST